MARRDFATTPVGIMSGLRRIAPDITIDTVWSEDPYFIWDGEGPDPVNKGYVPHNVVVRAEVQTVDGETLSGDDGLGGVYERPGVEPGDVHGHFYDMLGVALSELYIALTGKAIPVGRKAWDPREKELEDPERAEYAHQVKAAITFTERSSKAIYERDERRRRRG